MTTSAGDAAEARRDDIGIAWYVAALVAYVATGYATQSVVLNWIIGPLFPFILLYAAPALASWARSLIGSNS